MQIDETKILIDPSAQIPHFNLDTGEVVTPESFFQSDSLENVAARVFGTISVDKETADLIHDVVSHLPAFNDTGAFVLNLKNVVTPGKIQLCLSPTAAVLVTIDPRFSFLHSESDKNALIYLRNPSSYTHFPRWVTLDETSENKISAVVLYRLAGNLLNKVQILRKDGIFSAYDRELILEHEKAHQKQVPRHNGLRAFMLKSLRNVRNAKTPTTDSPDIDITEGELNMFIQNVTVMKALLEAEADLAGAVNFQKRYKVEGAVDYVLELDALTILMGFQKLNQDDEPSISQFFTKPNSENISTDARSVNHFWGYIILLFGSEIFEFGEIEGKVLLPTISSSSDGIILPEEFQKDIQRRVIEKIQQFSAGETKIDTEELLASLRRLIVSYEIKLIKYAVKKHEAGLEFDFDPEETAARIKQAEEVYKDGKEK